MSTPTKERAEQLANMVEKRRQAIESMLMDIKEQRGEDAQLEPGEQARYRQMTEDLRSLQDHAEPHPGLGRSWMPCRRSVVAMVVGETP
jgi:hypothetical protein